jgi:1-deoxy-D-xylulose-5-phosphate reductoisomerase
LNAANEVAVNAFLEKNIGFGDIARIIRSVMDRHSAAPADDIETVLNADSAARRSAIDQVAKLSKSAIAA